MVEPKVDTVCLAIAEIIDGEAHQAIIDGRDALPDSLWCLRRELAQAKAYRIIHYLNDLAHARRSD